MKRTHMTFANKAAVGPAATGAVFSLQQTAEAAIVYSGLQNVTATVPGSSGNDVENLNINGVGGNDLRIIANPGEPTGPTVISVPFSWVGSMAMAASPRMAQ